MTDKRQDAYASGLAGVHILSWLQPMSERTEQEIVHATVSGWKQVSMMLFRPLRKEGNEAHDSSPQPHVHCALQTAGPIPPFLPFRNHNLFAMFTDSMMMMMDACMAGSIIPSNPQRQLWIKV